LSHYLIDKKLELSKVVNRSEKTKFICYCSVHRLADKR